MKTEELLRPRYKCIADYPYSDFNIGDVFETYNGGASGQVVCIKHSVGDDTFISPDDYPHLFKKLHWYENRKIEDMPKYVKVNGKCSLDIGSVHKPIKIGEFIEEVKTVLDEDASIYYYIIEGSTFNINASHFMPATESAYLEYLNTKP